MTCGFIAVVHTHMEGHTRAVRWKVGAQAFGKTSVSCWMLEAGGSHRIYDPDAQIMACRMSNFLLGGLVAGAEGESRRVQGVAFSRHHPDFYLSVWIRRPLICSHQSYNHSKKINNMVNRTINDTYGALACNDDSCM